MLSPEVSKLCGDLGRPVSQFSIALWVLWMQAPLVFTARFFGGIVSQVQALKVGVPGWVSNPSLLTKKLWVRGYGEIMSQPFLPTTIWFLSYLPNVQESVSF